MFIPLLLLFGVIPSFLTGHQSFVVFVVLSLDMKAPLRGTCVFQAEPEPNALMVT